MQLFKVFEHKSLYSTIYNYLDLLRRENLKFAKKRKSKDEIKYGQNEKQNKKRGNVKLMWEHERERARIYFPD